MSFKNDGWHEVMCDDLMMAEMLAKNPLSEPPIDSEKAGLIFYNDELRLQIGNDVVVIPSRVVASVISKSDANQRAIELHAVKVSP